MSFISFVVSAGLTPVDQHQSCTLESKRGHTVLDGVLKPATWITSLAPLVTLFLMQPPAADICCWLMVSSLSKKEPHILLSRAASQIVEPQPVVLHGAIPSYKQDLALMVLHDISGNLKLVQVPLSGSLALQDIDCFLQHVIVYKITEDALCPITWVVTEDFKQDWLCY